MTTTPRLVILAAGKGTRLQALTTSTPKPLLPIAGRPLIGHTVSWLARQGVTDIGVNLHTMGESIEDYLGDGRGFGVTVFYSWEECLLGTAGALPRFRDWLGDESDFLVVYGDILTNQDLAILIDKHRAENAFATLLLHRRRASNSCVELSHDGRVTAFYERPEAELRARLEATHPSGFLVNSAVQMLSRRALDYIEEHGCFDLPRDVYMPLVGEERIFGVELTGFRIAIDSPERYLEACRAVEGGVLERTVG